VPLAVKPASRPVFPRGPNVGSLTGLLTSDGAVFRFCTVFGLAATGNSPKAAFWEGATDYGEVALAEAFADTFLPRLWYCSACSADSY
jgi:hypothetical protein